jgi:hypothetical protein
MPSSGVARFIGVGVVALAISLLLGAAEAGFGPVRSDQRISFMGPNGNPAFDAGLADVAYNSRADEYLAVWDATDNTPPVANELEIYAQRLSGSGAPLGARIRVSEQGPDGNPSWLALYPSVGYNRVTNEYLVAWIGQLDVAGRYEIWARRVSATGERLGPRADLRVSESSVALIDLDARPSIAVNTATGEYLVTWVGRFGTAPEFEVLGQLVTASGEINTFDFRISAQGADGDPNSTAGNAAVAYNATKNEYLVVWQGEVGSTNEFEIWGRRLSAAGTPLGGADDIQISAMGPPNDNDYFAGQPGVTVNSRSGEYLVVWVGDDNTTPLVDDELEIFGQVLTASGTETGPDDFRISEQGADGNPDSSAFSPTVAYDPIGDEYLVAWVGEIGTTEGFEIWAQRLTALAVELGGNDFQLSGGGSGALGVPRIAANATFGEYGVVWTEDHDGTGELEIYGHWLGLVPPVLVAMDPPGPADQNSPRITGSTDSNATVDVFKNSQCLGSPAVTDAPASALNGTGIAVPVADNSVNEFSVRASNDGRTSRCSNSIAYIEATPPAPPAPPPSPPPPGANPAPVVSGFAVSPRRFKAGKRTTFLFRLSERATSRIVVERSLPGRKQRFRRVVALTFRNRPAGQNRILFRRRGMKSGAYRATVTATDTAGKRSTPRRTSFTIVRG